MYTDKKCQRVWDKSVQETKERNKCPQYIQYECGRVCEDDSANNGHEISIDTVPITPNFVTLYDRTYHIICQNRMLNSQQSLKEAIYIHRNLNQVIGRLSDC